MKIHRILGVPTNTSESDMKKAFRKKAKEFHPDLGGNPKDFIVLNDAWKEYLNAPKVAKRIRRGFSVFDGSLFSLKRV